MKTKEISSKITTEIFGLEFTFKSNETDQEYIKMLANYVDFKMKEISKESGNRLSYHELAILSAINIADELFQQQNKLSDNELIITKTKQLIQLLDEGIFGDPVL